MTVQKRMRKWIVMATLRHSIIRAFERFDRKRFLVEHQRKMFNIAMRIKFRFRKRIKVYGKNL